MLLSALMLALLPAALSETATRAMLDKAGFGRLEQLADDLGGSGAGRLAKALLSPEDDWGDIPGKVLRRLVSALKSGLLEALTALSTPVLATLCLRLALGRADGPLKLLCRLACACELSRRFSGAYAIAASAMANCVRVAEVASPVLCATLTLTGSAAGAAALSPAASLCAGIIGRVLTAAGLPACALAAAVASADCLSDRFRLDKLFSLLRRWSMWGVQGMVAAFVGLLAVEGRLAAARDTASSHALRQALRGLIPYIGGSVSESTGALLESAAAARGTVGVTGVALAVCAGAGPVLRLAIHGMSLKLASAVIEPVADPGITRVVSGFSDIAGMLVALCAGSALLTALLAGACLGFG